MSSPMADAARVCCGHWPMRTLPAWLLAFVLSMPLAPPAAASAQPPSRMSNDAQRLLQWVKRSGDHGGAPFVVIDKPHARLWLFDGSGAELGDTPVLLGLARGDHTVPGIGERAIADIRPHERTTPAGRFIAEPGRNLHGEDIFWIDYDAALSMHRVRATHASERRLQRLASPTPADNRISYGCINVPAEFYDTRIKPLLGRHAVVYLLPDTLPLDRLFGALGDVRGGTRAAAAAAEAGTPRSR